MKNSLKEFSLKKMIFQPQFAKKFCCMFFGILFMGFFLSFLIKINWGTDPASFHNKTISLALGWTFGNWQLLYNTVCFVIVLLINCKLIGLGTFFNWVLIGYTADFFCWLWDRTIPAAIFSTNEYLALKLTIFVLALLLFVISAAFYMNAQLGLSPYDALARIFSEATEKHMPHFASRIIYDMTIVAIGATVGIIFGVPIKTALPGSIAVGLLLGPAIQLVGTFVNKHILKIES